MAFFVDVISCRRNCQYLAGQTSVILKRTGIKLRLFLLLFSIASLLEMFSAHEWIGGVIRYDASGYYLYLPATFIYKDLDHLDFYPVIDSTYHLSDNLKWYGIFDQPQTGRRSIMYPLGVAIGEAPFFAAAHGYSLLSGEYKADGYSLAYQFAIGIGNFLWVLAGLCFLGKLLMKFWSENVVVVTLLIIAVGTNLHAYTISNYGMSHPFVFLLFSMLLYYTVQWNQLKKPGYLYAIALLIGLIAISRPTDILVAIIPFFGGVTDRSTWQLHIRTLAKNGAHVVAALIVFAAILFLQAAYWKWTTGHYLYYSYHEAGFDFLHPHLAEGLFSYQKGWFLYTPLALIAFAGLIPLNKKMKAQGTLILIYFLLVIYITFSWTQWWYGWSFGCRPLIESLAVLALPLAAAMEWLGRRQKWLRFSSAVAIAFFIYLNIFQTHQTMSNVLPGAGVTKAYYWRVFNKMEATDEDRRLLQ